MAPRLALALALMICCVAVAVAVAATPAGSAGTRFPAVGAGRIAARIAGRPVAVHCSTWVAWRKHSTSELGFVRTRYDTGTRQYVESASAIELSPRVCRSLRRFARAAEKPTSCHAVGQPDGPCFLGRRVARDDRSPKICYRIASVSTCYATAADRGKAYWDAYQGYAEALFTLAHEAIHVQQTIRGAPVTPDSLVEVQANCWGMQWISYVAAQLGATGIDARSLATYAWLTIYPASRLRRDAYSRKHPYWSRSCRPGGPLDIRARPTSAADWPS